MKKKLIWIIVGFIAAAAVVYYFLNKRAQKATQKPAGCGCTAAPFDITTPGAFTKRLPLNYQRIVNGSTKNAKNEVVALQAMLNYYFGNTRNYTPGIWDDQMAADIFDITGKGSITLYEFRYRWFDQRYTDQEAANILDNIYQD